VDLADAYYEALIQYLRGRNAKHLDEAVLADAASETWMSLCKNPDSYNGTGSLWAFLKRSAQGDLQNALKKEGRRRRHEKAVAYVELFDGDGKIGEDHAEDAARVRDKVLPLVSAGLVDEEVRCLELILARERRTARYAEALGIADRPASEQKMTVYRVKKKLMKRIERARRDHDDTP
jgi:DNA-directed RNA polymerase specialized sigma24 family protein